MALTCLDASISRVSPRPRSFYCILFFLLLFPQFAHAGPIADVLCYVLNIVLGNFGRGLATIAVIMLGFGALMGKVSWAMAMIVATGIAVVFGAPSIVLMLLGAFPSCSFG